MQNPPFEKGPTALDVLDHVLKHFPRSSFGSLKRSLRKVYHGRDHGFQIRELEIVLTSARELLGLSEQEFLDAMRGRFPARAFEWYPSCEQECIEALASEVPPAIQAEPSPVPTRAASLASTA